METYKHFHVNKKDRNSHGEKGEQKTPEYNSNVLKMHEIF